VNGWRKSPERWRKSSHSAANGCCVETCYHDGHIQVRDSKNPGGPRLTFTPAAWAAFIAAVKDGRIT
jgi:hypothetical protein